MNFSVNAEIDMEQICEEIEKKASQIARKKVDEELEKRIIKKLDDYDFEKMIDKYVEDHFARAINDAVNKCITKNGYFWYSTDRRSEKELEAFYLGSTCNRLNELAKEIQYSPSAYIDKVVESTAQQLSKRITQSKAKMISLANQIVENWDKEATNDPN